MTKPKIKSNQEVIIPYLLNYNNKKNHKFLDKSKYFWLAFASYCFHGYA